MAAQVRDSAQAALERSILERSASAGALLARSAPPSFWAAPSADSPALSTLDSASDILLSRMGMLDPAIADASGRIVYARERSRVGSAVAVPEFPSLPLFPWGGAEAPSEAPVSVALPEGSPLSGSLLARASIRSEWLAASQIQRKSLSALATLLSGSAFLFLLPLSAASRKLAESARSLSEISSIDPSTGALAREHALVRLAQEHSRAARGISESLSVFLVEIDHFQVLSLAYGEGVAESAVLEVSARVFHNARGYDVVGRHLRPSEFLVILPGADASSARIVADRLRRSISERPVGYDDLAVRATVSIGVASFRKDSPEETPESMLERAKSALRAAQDRGGDAFIAL